MRMQPRLSRGIATEFCVPRHRLLQDRQRHVWARSRRPGPADARTDPRRARGPDTFVARLGGEEFVVMFIDQAPEQVEGFVMRVRSEFEHHCQRIRLARQRRRGPPPTRRDDERAPAPRRYCAVRSEGRRARSDGGQPRLSGSGRMERSHDCRVMPSVNRNATRSLQQRCFTRIVYSPPGTLSPPAKSRLPPEDSR